MNDAEINTAISRAYEVFGNMRKAILWLTRPNAFLVPVLKPEKKFEQGEEVRYFSPIDLSLKEILDTLNRIENGVVGL